MKKILIIFAFLLWSINCQATDITYTDKATGGQFTAADANEIKTAVNSKLDKSPVVADGGIALDVTPSAIDADNWIFKAESLDETSGHIGMRVTNSFVENGVRNRLFTLGYNDNGAGNPELVGEPTAFYAIEPHYYNGVNHFVEAYLQIKPSLAEAYVRPWQVAYDRVAKTTSLSFAADDIKFWNPEMDGLVWDMVPGERISFYYKTVIGGQSPFLTALLSVRGQTKIGNTETHDSKTPLQVSGNMGDTHNGTLFLVDSQSAGAGVGGSMVYGGKYLNENITGFAEIRGIKETGTGGDYAGALSLRTRTNGNSLTEQVRVAGDGKVGVGTTSPKSALHVVGLPVYANNAAAIAGGLTAGAFYRTGADPDPVMVVH